MDIDHEQTKLIFENWNKFVKTEITEASINEGVPVRAPNQLAIAGKTRGLAGGPNYENIVKLLWRRRGGEIPQDVLDKLNNIRNKSNIQNADLPDLPYNWKDLLKATPEGAPAKARVAKSAAEMRDFARNTKAKQQRFADEVKAQAQSIGRSADELDQTLRDVMDFSDASLEIDFAGTPGDAQKGFLNDVALEGVYEDAIRAVDEMVDTGLARAEQAASRADDVRQFDTIHPENPVAQARVEQGLPPFADSPRYRQWLPPMPPGPKHKYPLKVKLASVWAGMTPENRRILAWSTLIGGSAGIGATMVALYRVFITSNNKIKQVEQATDEAARLQSDMEKLKFAIKNAEKVLKTDGAAPEKLQKLKDKLTEAQSKYQEALQKIGIANRELVALSLRAKNILERVKGRLKSIPQGPVALDPELTDLGTDREVLPTTDIAIGEPTEADVDSLKPVSANTPVSINFKNANGYNVFKFLQREMGYVENTLLNDDPAQAAQDIEKLKNTQVTIEMTATPEEILKELGRQTEVQFSIPKATASPVKKKSRIKVRNQNARRQKNRKRFGGAF